ncbi:MAG: hypothetical protein Q8P50_04450 [Bacillota bacterium]|nr:hypothetical protein [Bacillota bacterium]
MLGRLKQLVRLKLLLGLSALAISGLVASYSVVSARPDATAHETSPAPVGTPVPKYTPNDAEGWKPYNFEEEAVGRLRAALEGIPADRRLLVDEDTIANVARPLSTGQIVLAVHHIPSRSVINFDATGKLTYERYGSPAGKARLQSIQSDPAIMREVMNLVSRISP